RTAGRALRFHRLRREQRGGRCVFTGCAANSGAGAAFSQAAPRTAGRELRFYRLYREFGPAACMVICLFFNKTHENRAPLGREIM
ncbi:hypothetical protein, partial [Anaerotruncus sp.]|uniref:hypothetical protein n=1 Tax=Anaerotruncus sp. TaxID=1872531 RepID=UPI0025C3DFC3